MVALLSTFVAVVNAGSFSEAGRRLGQPKSAISRRIEVLEKRLGARLLQRSTRAVRPTDIGQEYYNRCVHILAEIEEAEQIVRKEQLAPSGPLRVQLPIEFGMCVLGDLMAEFAQANPGILLQLELSTRHVDLIDEQYDLAVRIGAMPHSSLVARKILTIRRGIYASPEYLARHGEPESPNDLELRSCLRFRTDYYAGDWLLTGPRGRVSLQPSGSVSANNMTVILDAAIRGLGVALLPYFLCREAVGTGRLRPVLREWMAEDSAFVLYPSKRHLTTKVRSFLDFLDARLAGIARSINMPPDEYVAARKPVQRVRQRAPRPAD